MPLLSALDRVAFLDRAHTVAPPGYSRWLIPPAALSVHLCIGQAYATSVYKNSLIAHFDASQTAIGIMMATGQGLHRDFVFARLWLRHAADQGNPYAQANLAILYRDGLGGRKDVAAARELLTKAASAGVAEAAEVLKDLKG